ncbi:hypothetical protein EDC96DRAFT_542494 [Choanephora cucurbitarum]|nr:hypothetical protein EDC96DRAFT_546574 [Choanephora cucurbitarum]KAI8371150.1 hypothetical protein EDC96DRAFT_542494 [Choanephora cucurbitarum]
MQKSSRCLGQTQLLILSCCARTRRKQRSAFYPIPVGVQRKKALAKLHGQYKCSRCLRQTQLLILSCCARTRRKQRSAFYPIPVGVQKKKSTCKVARSIQMLAMPWTDITPNRKCLVPRLDRW